MEPDYKQVVQPEPHRLEELGRTIKAAGEKTSGTAATPPHPGPRPTPPDLRPSPPASEPPPARAEGQLPEWKRRRCGERASRSPCTNIDNPAEQQKCLNESVLFGRPTAIVISGGVSLGSHQGGVLHYLSQFLGSYSAYVRSKLAVTDARLPTGDIRVATGASAGSINAFISSMASCRAPVSNPVESLFYRTWIPVGMEGLDRETGVTSTSVLSRAPIDSAICRLRRLWQPGYRGGCSDDDIAQPIQGRWSDQACAGQLAFNVTRMVARDIPLPSAAGAGTLSAKRQTEQFVVRYEKQAGPNQEPKFFPVKPPESAMRALYPVLGKKGVDAEISLDDVFQLIKASSSFPVAFEPVELPHQLYGVDSSNQPVQLASDTSIRFIDGGVFDNTPLGVALTLSDWACEDPFFVFVEPDAIGWKKAAPIAKQQVKDETIFGTYGPFVSDFITVSRQAELLNAIAQHEQIRGTLQVPPRQLPTASGEILNFLGFFEKDFRRFDFYLGMTDSWDYLQRASVAAQKNESGNRQYRILAAAGKLPAIVDPVFECFKVLRSAEPNDFQAGPRPDPDNIPVCRNVKAAEPNLIALYLATGDLRAYMQTAGWNPDDEQNQFFRFLERRKFAFKDLKDGNEPVEASAAQALVRTRLQSLAHRLAMAQPGVVAKQAVSVAGKAVLNSVRYRTPPVAAEINATINGAGFGGALMFTTAYGWRAELVGTIEPWHVRQLDTAAGADTTWLMQSAVGALVGKEWAFGGSDAPPSGRWQLAVTAGVEGRVVTGNYDIFPWLVPDDALLWRFGPTARVRATFYQRLTLGAALTYWPDDCAGTNDCDGTTDRAKALLPVVSERGRFGLFVAWRFLDIFSF
jgi:predicted acylesterase/phospholipase RssA